MKIINTIIPALVIIGLIGFYMWFAYDKGKINGRAEGRKECLETVREEVAKIKAEREKFTVDDVIIKPEMDLDLSGWAVLPGDTEYKIYLYDLQR